jgi:uncharacterized protein (DUF1697 family)
MASVVLLRGVNVGGHRKFQPSVLAKELADLGAVSVGAAGTFVIRKAIGQTALRAEFLRRLPFEAELMVCKGSDLLNLTWEDSNSGDPTTDGARRFVSVLAQRPRSLPPLPLYQPAGAVEKKLGVSATTRGWETIASVCDILKGG